VNVYPNAKFIVTINTAEYLAKSHREQFKRIAVTDSCNCKCNIFNMVRRIRESSGDLLILPEQEPDKWKPICQFLECVPSLSPFPVFEDQFQRKLSLDNIDGIRNHFPRTHKLRFDSLPWIAISNRNWIGVPSGYDDYKVITGEDLIAVCEQFRKLDTSFWQLRDDTFPSNLAIFNPSNISNEDDGTVSLILNKKNSGVRNYTSASICSRHRFLYGRFEAEIKPANTPGVMTGVFLHRNSPRQEIDIELLGKDTTKLLLNVYYNPGGEGARFEYGYRGTPVLIDLGFDASDDFHRYKVELSSAAIRWFVDDRLVHERFNWEPTPIPHLPMKFHINLWPPRSTKLAGRLVDRLLPACTFIKSINLKSFSPNEDQKRQNAEQFSSQKTGS